ncbi:hypothetical protein SESBI_51030, partial [Sesbania bispinosa]
LSAWRVRRNARLRERKRSEAIEMQKLRKTATRRCRNCLNPYRDQNPGGGRFMCSYCGHVSKRPVLDLPVPPGLGMSNSGIVKDLVGKSGKILNSKVILTTGGQMRMLVFWRRRALFDREIIFWALLAKRGENGASLNESRGEKARRKAEEKRQARLEKELLEEEERKQREEVARLVEERRRLRDEKMEAEKDRSKSSNPSKEKNSRKEAEKKRQEKRREKDKGSSKSNSDAEEVERRAIKESERKRDLDKKNEMDRRENQKSGLESGKGLSTDNAHSKNVTANNYNRGSTGTRGTNVPATVVKENKFSSSVDHVHTAASRRNIGPPERPAAKSNLNGDDRNANHSVLPESQPWKAPKKSWQQLFTRSSSVSQSSNSNVICRPNSKIQAEAKIGNTHDEQELFEDPCYVPDPVSLLGPVSESLDNFQLDLGSGFGTDMEVTKPHSLKNISAGSDVNKPSPIESPLSREKHSSSNWFPSTPKGQDMHAFPVDDAAANEKGTWQMWSTSPLGQEGLGLVGGPEAGFYPHKGIYDPWLQSAFFPPLSSGFTAQEGATQNEVIYGSPSGSASSHVHEGSPANSWSKKEWPVHGSVESLGKSSVSRPHNGGLQPTSDVQSFWSFD